MLLLKDVLRTLFVTASIIHNICCGYVFGDKSKKCFGNIIPFGSEDSKIKGESYLIKQSINSKLSENVSFILSCQ